MTSGPVSGPSAIDATIPIVVLGRRWPAKVPDGAGICPCGTLFTVQGVQVRGELPGAVGRSHARPVAIGVMHGEAFVSPRHPGVKHLVKQVPRSPHPETKHWPVVLFCSGDRRRLATECMRTAGALTRSGDCTPLRAVHPPGPAGVVAERPSLPCEDGVNRTAADPAPCRDRGYALTSLSAPHAGALDEDPEQLPVAHALGEDVLAAATLQSIRSVPAERQLPIRRGGMIALARGISYTTVSVASDMVIKLPDGRAAGNDTPRMHRRGRLGRRSHPEIIHVDARPASRPAGRLHDRRRSLVGS
jgi:hypothetical protein